MAMITSYYILTSIYWPHRESRKYWIYVPVVFHYISDCYYCYYDAINSQENVLCEL